MDGLSNWYIPPVLCSLLIVQLVLPSLCGIKKCTYIARWEGGQNKLDICSLRIVVVREETCFGQLVAAEICDVVIYDGRNQGFDRLNY